MFFMSDNIDISIEQRPCISCTVQIIGADTLGNEKRLPALLESDFFLRIGAEHLKPVTTSLLENSLGSAGSKLGYDMKSYHIMETLPDETALFNFCHLMEEHQLRERLLEAINPYLKEQGLMVSQGAMSDATIIQTPIQRTAQFTSGG